MKAIISADERYAEYLEVFDDQDPRAASRDAIELTDSQLAIVRDWESASKAYFSLIDELQLTDATLLKFSAARYAEIKGTECVLCSEVSWRLKSKGLVDISGTIFDRRVDTTDLGKSVYESMIHAASEYLGICVDGNEETLHAQLNHSTIGPVMLAAGRATAIRGSA
jgi:hypothetical protein